MESKGKARHNNNNNHSNHNHSAMIKDFKKRFFISLIITIPILVLSPMIQSFLNYNFTLFRGFDKFILLFLSTIVFFYGGWPFLDGLRNELKKKSPGMMTLVAVAITVAWGYSSATTFGIKGDTFFWELSTLVVIMLFGHWIEMKSIMGASKSLHELIELMPKKAHLIKESETVDIKIDELNIDDSVLIKPGEKIPADGTITNGSSQINESMITGESKPIQKRKNDKVIGGTINGNGTLEVKVKQIGENAYLNKVINMVKEAQNKKSKTQNMADKLAFWLIIVALSVGLGTLITWLSLGRSFSFSLERMATVMVITCPHALGLAVPLVVAISTTISAKNGLLIRNRTAFENSRRISTLVFDKTGTLTKGNFAVSTYKSLNQKYSDNDILRFSAAMEKKSEHPLALAILNQAKKENIDLPEVSDFKAITGKGIKAKINKKRTQLVSSNYLKEQGKKIPSDVDNDISETIVYLVIEDEISGYITLSDEIRKESYDAVKTLKESGLKIYMLTGDNKKVASKVSNELELDGYYANILPDQKLKIIEDLKSKGEFVAMTGDGINDAPALATADVGIAVGSGTDIAADTADIILVNSNPKDIASLIIFGKSTYNKMVQNFIWATAYNIVTIPLATGILLHKGIIISPALGALLMSLSTIIVAINAQLLKRKIGA